MFIRDALIYLQCLCAAAAVIAGEVHLLANLGTEAAGVAGLVVLAVLE